MALKRILKTYIEQNENTKDPNISFDVLLAKKELEKLDKRITSDELLQKHGGKWLGKIRSWIQWNCYNGDQVIWSTHDILRFKTITVKEMQQLAAEIATAAINEERQGRF